MGFNFLGIAEVSVVLRTWRGSGQWPYDSIVADRSSERKEVLLLSDLFNFSWPQFGLSPAAWGHGEYTQLNSSEINLLVDQLYHDTTIKKSNYHSLVVGLPFSGLCIRTTPLCPPPQLLLPTVQKTSFQAYDSHYPGLPCLLTGLPDEVGM